MQGCVEAIKTTFDAIMTIQQRRSGLAARRPKDKARVSFLKFRHLVRTDLKTKQKRQKLQMLQDPDVVSERRITQFWNCYLE